MHAKSVPFASHVLRIATAFGLAFLPGGCMGVPQTFYAAEPAAPERPAPPRLAPKPAPVAHAPALSESEKRRLFQDFQHSQSAKDQADIAPEPVP